MPPPNILYSCPCSDSDPITNKPTGLTSDLDSESSFDPPEASTFDPWSPRSTFSLFPLSTLLFCEDCNTIRCPRCVSDEIVCYYCPSCLFESPSSTVKSEGNRCTRNCFSCPLCFASLTTTPLGPDQTAPYILLCPHCAWSSSDINITFEKPTSIATQLTAKLKALRGPSPEDAHFEQLREHYNRAKAASGSDAEGSLSRLMGIYGRRNYTLATRAKPKPDWSESTPVPIADESALIASLATAGWAGTPSAAQRVLQPHNPHLLSELTPIPSLLRTKRSKRCRACRHILVKPEAKPSTMRFRIKLIAMSYITALSLTRLEPPPGAVHLRAGETAQFTLTLTNPLFDPISVQLATPLQTPGRWPAEVTILCPSFQVGANTDVWDEALGQVGAVVKRGKRMAAAGTVWDAGRNWTTVVLEVMAGDVPDEVGDEERRVRVPILVRTVYDTVVEREGKEVKERREQAYWSVVEVGRVERSWEKVEAEEREKEREKEKEKEREREERRKSHRVEVRG